MSAVLQLLLLTALGAFQIAWAFNGALVVAPNAFRIGVEETIFIQPVQLTADTDVTITLNSPAAGNAEYASKTIRVKKDEPMVTTLALNANAKQLLSDLKNYMGGINPGLPVVQAVIKATAKGKLYQKFPPVKVALSSGTIFLQTDKPIYSPGQEVKLRVIVTDNSLTAISETIMLEFINPRNLIVYQEKLSNFPPSKILRHNYPLGSEPILGLWTVNARSGYEFFTSTNVTFEVKEYVLPTYDVRIEFTQKYILPETKIIEGKVIARYTFEEPVDGTVALRFIVQSKSGEQQKAFDELTGKLVKGEFPFKLDLTELRKTSPSPLLKSWFPDVTGSRLKLVAIATESGTYTREIVTNIDTLFVTSPYIISFTKSLPDFKPGYSYNVKVGVHHPNGDPAVGVPIGISEISMGALGKQLLPPQQTTNFRGTATFTVAVPFKTTELLVTVVTKDPKYSAAANANKQLKALSHQPMAGPGVGYLWLSPRDAIDEVRIGSILTVEAAVYNPNNIPYTVHYLIVAHGRVVSWGKPSAQRDTYLWVMNVEVKPQMSPSFRLVVYAIQHQPPHKGYFLADSLRVDVESKCPYNANKELKLSLSKDSFAPKNSGFLKILGEKDSYVGVMAVDQAIYALRNESILTRSKLFTEWDKADVGHGPGGGLNVGAILKNAGLVALFPGDQLIEYPVAAVGGTRRKRAAINFCCDEALDSTNSTAGTCTMSTEFYCENSAIKGCYEEFTKCCPYGGNAIIPTNTSCGNISILYTPEGRDVLLEPDEDEEFYEVPTANDIRTNFPETWLYEDFQIGDARCPPTKNGESCHLSINAFPDSITSWNFHALAISPTTGFCVAETIKTTVKKSLFIKLKLPYAAVRTELLELVATVFNYGAEKQRVLLFMNGVDGLCCEAKPGERGKVHRLSVPEGGTVSHRFQIMPMKTGEFPITVTARSILGADVIIKNLRVIEEGIRETKSSSQLLDPSNKIHVRTKRQDLINVPFEDFGKILNNNPDEKRATVAWDVSPPPNAIPGTVKAYLEITGLVLGPTLDTMIHGVDGFFQDAVGCAEQCMIRIAPTIYSVLYLKFTGQLTITQEEKAKKHLAQGYGFAMRYRQPNGAITVWQTPVPPPTIWLSSYFMRVFCEMRTFLSSVQTSVISSGLKWIAVQQRPDGSWDGKTLAIHHLEMTGGLQGTDSLTAFTLTAYAACNDQTKDFLNVITKARTYLENTLESHKTHPYTLALVTYALALTNSTKAQKANEYLSKLAQEDAQGNRYWVFDVKEIEMHGAKKPWVYTTKPTALSVEITAYALLAQVTLNKMDYAGPIVGWLANQRNSKGAFISTQDTAVALEALAVYGKKAKQLDEGKTLVDVYINDGLLNDKPFTFDKTSKNVLKSIEVPIGSRVRVEAKGDIPISTTIQLKYNSPGKSEDKKAYDIEINTIDVMNPAPQQGKDRPVVFRNRHIVDVRVCIGYNLKKTSGMVIARVGIPTGYRVDQANLREIRANKEYLISNLETADSSIILYFNQIPPTPNKLCFPIRIVRSDIVQDLQPATVLVYTYYEPDEVSSQFYSVAAEEEGEEKKCVGEMCSCQKGSCPMYVNEDLYMAMSRDGLTEILDLMCSKNKYSYIVKIKSVSLSQDTMHLHQKMIATVVKVISGAKEKADKVLQQDREFYMASKCTKFQVNSYYLITGEKMEVVKTIKNVNNFRYIVDDTAVVWDFPSKYIDKVGIESPLHFVMQRLQSDKCFN